MGMTNTITTRHEFGKVTFDNFFENCEEPKAKTRVFTEEEKELFEYLDFDTKMKWEEKPEEMEMIFRSKTDTKCLWEQMLDHKYYCYLVEKYPKMTIDNYYDKIIPMIESLENKSDGENVFTIAKDKYYQTLRDQLKNLHPDPLNDPREVKAREDYKKEKEIDQKIEELRKIINPEKFKEISEEIRFVGGILCKKEILKDLESEIGQD